MRNHQIVLAEIKNAVAQERKCQLKVLHLLREVERDGHYLEMGYPSLFEFTTQALGYSSGSAHRRIQSMRLLKILPEMESKIEDGSLSLCVAAKTQSFFRTEDQKRKSEGDEKLGLQAKQEIAQSMLGTSMRECEKKLAEISPESALPPEKTRELSRGKTLIQFSADAELMEKIEKLKGLLAHQNPDGSYEGLFEILAELALKKIEPKKPNPESPQPEPSGNDANTPSVSTLETQRSRTIPAEVKRQVFARDGGCCTYQDQSTGKRCGSRFAIEYDHIQPFAWGGETIAKNLRIRCRFHNSYTAKKQGLIRDSKSL
ncbi:HNH endonuclease signature motif containing protein [Bdellovibrionota bacterium FG-1]